MNRLAFWLGVLELGFVIGVATGQGLAILAIAGPACFMLMLPQLREWRS